jgi:DNA-binding NarL/FixJ family response regulator
MRPPRILILSDQPLFAEGIRSLILEQTHLAVVAIVSCGDQLANKVHELEPDIIVLGDDNQLPTPDVACLLGIAPTAHLVRITLAENVIRVYDGGGWISRQAQDLVVVLDSIASRIGKPEDANAV